MEKKNSLLQKGWKNNVVLLAKNTYVWLKQLSVKYNTPITHLDQIPQEELAEISSRGFNALRLVGVWERSPASRQIKHLYGRKDAIASAYSIYEYRIAADLGGENAYTQLKEIATDNGIRLACDMVPNHTGLDSPWLFTHPDWYISTKTNPIENFKYDSPNLSPNPAAGVYLEEGYYNQTGAAEVFKYAPNRGDDSLYIYHGNDGTSMPWNDTAQLNYLNSATRQAVLEEILSVARKFRIIRLDAAMTLVRKHFKRLWFPSKGGEKFIPTRGNNNMTEREFDRLMPEEFWKEVVQRLNSEAPDTLFVAEAFWLMEKYFINEIGMHRVYNSAFMHQLRDEKNADFKEYLADILQTDPRMLERFANFLTTPDERTTLDQFRKDEKYFGACRLLACMPGLPMFGHGQWEGLRERYGMDISRPMLDEKPDDALIKQHDEIITPLLKDRPRFTGSENFVLYDFVQQNGKVNDDVIVFSNRFNEQRTLVVFNNQDKPAEGRFHESIELKSPANDHKTVKYDLLKALDLSESKSGTVILRDIPSGNTRENAIKEMAAEGIPFDLHPYESHVYAVEYRE